MSSDKKTTFRETYQLLEFLGDIGGLLEISMLFVGYFVTWVARGKINQYFAHKMYLKPNLDWDEAKEKKKDPGQKIPGINCFECRYILCKLILCCRSKSFRKDEDILERASHEMQR